MVYRQEEAMHAMEDDAQWYMYHIIGLIGVLFSSIGSGGSSTCFL